MTTEADLADYIKRGLSPEARLKLMVEQGIDDDTLSAMEVLVADDYPVRQAITLAGAMKRNHAAGQGKTALEQARHFVMLRSVLR